MREVLLRHVVVLYTELDVIWFRDITQEITALFFWDAYVEALIEENQIYDFGRSIARPTIGVDTPEAFN